MNPMTQRAIRTTLIVLASLALVPALLVDVAHAASTNRAATFRWPAYVDTDLKLADFFVKSHTITARFMPQYPRADEGPIITGSDASGTFELGQGDYRDTVKLTKLVLRVGGQKLVYFATLEAGKWQHLALVRRNLVYNGLPISSTFELYINGQHRCAGLILYGNACPEAKFDGTGPGAPGGNLRIGRREGSEAGNRQFYGFVDDVAVFSKALGEAELQGLVAAKRLNGGEAGLLRGWTFDDATPAGLLLPATLNHAPAMVQGAKTTIVSQTRDNAADKPLVPLPNPSYSPPAFKLPFKSGQAWYVMQEWASTGSHSGYAAFSLDFGLVGPESQNKVANPNNPSDSSCGEPLYAAAPGSIVWTYDSGGYDDPADDPNPGGLNNDFDGPNALTVKHSYAPFSYATYMHTFTGSIAASFPGYWQLYGELPPWGPDIAVVTGTKLATVGTRNSCHLHFGVGNSTGDLDLDPLNESDPLPYANYPSPS